MKTKILFQVHLSQSKFIILLLMLTTFSNFLKAQDCTTPDIQPEVAMNFPWFGNPDYLPAFMDSLTAAEDNPSIPSISSIVPNIKWRIPIKFWILTTGNTPLPNNLLNDGMADNLPQERQLQILMDDLNSGFRNTEVDSKIQFYMKTPATWQVNNTGMTASAISLRLSTTSPDLFDDEAINVYIRTDEGGTFHSFGRSFICIEREDYGDKDVASTLTHEIGHYFGLGHTHQFANNRCYQEPVSRRAVGAYKDCFLGPYNFPWLPFVPRCSFTGDYLCDTEADPDMGDYTYNGTTCTFESRVTDYRGDVYRPLPNNYMGYQDRGCRTTFTKSQVGVMWWVLKHTPRGRSGKWRVDLAGRSFDIFEPNNTISGAISTDREGLGESHILKLNEPQLHSFHKDIDGDVMDNFDWIPIQTPPNGILENYIITAESTIPNLIEDIEVFTALDVNGISEPITLLARLVSNIEPNQTRWQISIPCDVVNDDTNLLYLRVQRNRNLNQFGTYTVIGTSREPSIRLEGGSPYSSDVLTVCTDTKYRANLIGMPTNTTDFTITWTQTIILDNGTTLPSTEIVSARNRYYAEIMTSELSGILLLETLILNNKTGCSVTIEREFRIGLIPVVNLEIETPVGINVQNLCPSLPLFLHGNLIETNGIDWSQVEEIEWTTSNPNFQLIPTPSTENRRVTVIPSSIPNDFTFIAFRVRNACGWSEQVIQLRNGKRDSKTCIGEPDAGFQVYPNPTDDFIDIDILCLCGIGPADPINPNPDPQKYSISRVDISDMFGTTRLSYQGSQIPVNPDGKIHINLSSLSAGNYILKLIMQDKVYMKHVIKQ